MASCDWVSAFVCSLPDPSCFSDSDRNARWRLYIDEECTRMLVKSMTVSSLHKAMVQTGVLDMGDADLRLFLHAVPTAETLL